MTTTTTQNPDNHATTTTNIRKNKRLVEGLFTPSQQTYQVISTALWAYIGHWVNNVRNTV